ncbi:hypothetical protein [Leptolyngbya sp. CCY15150]|uniref:hypothetical protein n=1 Tax=Leptolyngbya sp. CCY15150 TaxID=2767772 RepID=UPI00195155DF|nr:hypothetical protein [Leptolyngbya sp. CCY15150]
MKHRHVWHKLDHPKFALAYQISERIAERQWVDPSIFTDIRYGKEILVACDFSGSHSAANYEAFAFLIGAIGGSAKWMESRSAVRDRFLPDNRRMAYKSLNDAMRLRALPSFLDAANNFPGNLIVFLVSKKINNLFADPGTPGFLPELVVAERGWKKKSFQRLLLVASLGSLLVSCLTEPLQDILWVSDQDEIAANDKKHNHAGHVIHHCISRYAPDHQGLLVFLTTEGDLNTRQLEDIVAVPDLAAGALVDALSMCDALKRSSDERLWIPIPNELPSKAQTILQWFSASSFPLKRLVVVLDSFGSNIQVDTFVPVALESPLYLPNNVNSNDVFLFR